MSATPSTKDDSVTFNLPPDHALRNQHHNGGYSSLDEFLSDGPRGKGDVDTYGNPDQDYAENIADGMNVAQAEMIRETHYMRMSCESE